MDPSIPAAGPRTLAIVLAAGAGLRVGGELPKQLQRVGGRSLLRIAVDSLLASDRVDDVVVVAREELLETIRAEVGDTVLDVVVGGAERHDSVWAGLQRVERMADRVLVHDAARPIVPADLVARVVDALSRASAVVPVLPVPDTIAVLAGSRLVRVPPRGDLARVQTPQGFHLETLLAAHRAGRREEGFVPTDDATVVLRHGGPEAIVETVRGDERSFKVTVAPDLDRLAEELRRADR